MRSDGRDFSSRLRPKKPAAVTAAIWLAASFLGSGASLAADQNQPPPAAQPSQPAALSQPQAAAAQMQPLPAGLYATFHPSVALGASGYFEVTPANSLVLYPAYTSIPAVMQTILGMMGPLSVVGRRGFYTVSPGGELTLFLPPHSMPGMFATTGQMPAAPAAGMTGGAGDGSSLGHKE